MILGNFQVLDFLDSVIVVGLDVVPPGGKLNVKPRTRGGGVYNLVAMLIGNRDLNVAELFSRLVGKREVEIVTLRFFAH